MISYFLALLIVLPFGGATFDGFLEPEIAAYLRSVAERVVLRGEHTIQLKSDE